MDVLRTEITLRIHQGFPLPGYRATIVHMHYCGLDHAVMTPGKRPVVSKSITAKPGPDASAPFEWGILTVSPLEPLLIANQVVSSTPSIAQQQSLIRGRSENRPNIQPPRWWP